MFSSVRSVVGRGVGPPCGWLASTKVTKHPWHDRPHKHMWRGGGAKNGGGAEGGGGGGKWENKGPAPIMSDGTQSLGLHVAERRRTVARHHPTDVATAR